MKILFLSHIDWNWIKQRPQFLAEEFSNKYDVICITPHWYKRNKLQARDDKTESKIRFFEFYGIPKGKYNLGIRKINNFLRSIYTRLIFIKEKPDVIYIPSPELYRNWMRQKAARVIYDCMDDYVALSPTKEIAEYMKNSESSVVRGANYIVTSSANLKQLIEKKYNQESNDISIIRNGYTGSIISQKIDGFSVNKSELHIGYIGTVSSWFDSKSLISAVREIPNLYIHIIGPVQQDAPEMKNDRIIFEGVVEHNLLFDKIKNYDGLIMPFVVNHIVESVDPVKMYEYINFNKPIISVYYDEIKRFEPYVWFYGKDNRTLTEAVRDLVDKGIKYTEIERISILTKSNWKNRAEKFEEIIERLS